MQLADGSRQLAARTQGVFMYAVLAFIALTFIWAVVALASALVWELFDKLQHPTWSATATKASTLLVALMLGMIIATRVIEVNYDLEARRITPVVISCGLAAVCLAVPRLLRPHAHAE